MQPRAEEKLELSKITLSFDEEDYVVINGPNAEDEDALTSEFAVIEPSEVADEGRARLSSEKEQWKATVTVVYSGGETEGRFEVPASTFLKPKYERERGAASSRDYDFLLFKEAFKKKISEADLSLNPLELDIPVIEYEHGGPSKITMQGEFEQAIDYFFQTKKDEMVFPFLLRAETSMPIPLASATEETRAQKRSNLYYICHRFQIAFGETQVKSKAHEIESASMEELSRLLARIEIYDSIDGLDSEMIQTTKIHSALEDILKLPHIPRNEEFQFKARSKALLAKFYFLLNFSKRRTEPSLEPASAMPQASAPVEDLIPVNEFSRLSLGNDVVVGSAEQYYGSMLSRIRGEDVETARKYINEGTDGPTRAEVRMMKELAMFEKDTLLPYITFAPINGDVTNILAAIEGQPDSPYESGVFWIHITCPENYPVVKPTARFLTTIYHPNVCSDDGRIGLDLLESNWHPVSRLETLLLNILSILSDPMLEDAIVPEIALEFESDYQNYRQMAQFYTSEYAKAERPSTSDLVHMESITYDEVEEEENANA